MWSHVLGVAATLLLSSCLCEAVNENQETTVANATNARSGRLFSAFNVVRFPNTACNGGSNFNGTCYTAPECSAKGGQSSGSCASGYGVCCVFSLGCGGSSSQNCTYFVSTGSEIGECSLEICPCNNNICQLRLDFNTFSITGPSTDTTTNAVIGKIVNGQQIIGTSKGKSATTNTECLTDTFSVTNPGGNAPPVICGLNTGQHMYVDASTDCNDLAFQLGAIGIGASLTTKQWNIKVTQYSCDYSNLAPEGCTQYYYGSTSQSVQTYNYAGGIHLANQNQNICVRRERGQCRICWTTQLASDFQISGNAVKMGFNNPTQCCQYGKGGTSKSTQGFDCVVIPGAYTAIAAMKSITKPGFSRYCGRSAGLVSVKTGAEATAATVCTDQQPFNLRFLSDNFEYMMEYAGPAGMKTQPKGFKLVYIQQATPCYGLTKTDAGAGLQTPDGLAGTTAGR